MPRDYQKTITLPDAVYDRIKRYGKKYHLNQNDILQKSWDEYPAILALKGKIKVKPETVRRYT